MINTDAGTLGGKYKQEADIDLMGGADGVGVTGVPEWDPIGKTESEFSGAFDGAGFKIARLYINSPNASYVGLFGFENYATFANVHIASGSVTGKEYVGGLVGKANTGTDIRHCSNAADITGESQVGGIAGYASLNIFACYNVGDVTGSSGTVGGITGYLNSPQRQTSTITACYNSGTVRGHSKTGGLVGEAGLIPARAVASYNIGEVIGENYIGGLMGYAHAYLYMNACYNTAAVTGTGTTHSLLSNTVELKATDSYGKATGDGYTEITGDYFTPPNTGEWGTGEGTGSGTYWKEGTTDGTMLPKLWYEK